MKPAILLLSGCFALCLTPELRAQDARYSPRYELLPGTELVMVYIGASHCGPCLTEETKAAVRELKSVLSERAASRGQLFSAMGVSLDWEVSNGYEFLNDVAPWDEVVVGKNWTNIAASELLWRDDSTRAAIPQIMVFERDIDPTKLRFDVSDYRLLGQYFGISKWLENGAPIEKFD